MLTSEALRDRAAWIGIAIVLSIALALRLYGLDWDEGYAWTPHPDERAILSKTAELSTPSLAELPSLLDADRSPWNPRWFPYGSFPLYLLRSVHVIGEYALGVQIGDLRILARSISALADVFTVGMTYLLGRMLWSRRAGLIAAALVALAVVHIQLSHFYAVDTLLTLLSVATVLFLVRVARYGRATDSALAALFLGLALATKISASPLLAAYAVAHFMYAFRLSAASDRADLSILDAICRAAANAAFGGAVILASFLIVQPYALLDWNQFYADFVEQSEMVRRIRDYPYTRQYVDTAPYLYHIRQLSAWGLGWPFGILAWGGLATAAVRGLGPRAALIFAAAGVGLPVAILIVSSSSLAVVAASSISVTALALSIPARKPSTRMDALLLSWVLPYFMVIGILDVKFMRYLLPITPFLALFAARMFIAAWNATPPAASRLRMSARAALLIIGTAVLASTAFYAASYMRVYTADHPAVRGSEWVRANVPKGSVILKEHWEEGLPDLYAYRIRELPMYDHDTPQKIERMSHDLASAEMLTLYSNRLYGTIARLPERYPLSRAYYTLLFTGQLGYHLEAAFTSYPNLFGIEFVNETFDRPALPALLLSDGEPARAVSLSLGYADESFSVYDHPKTLLLRNVERLTADEIAARILAAAGDMPAVERQPAPPDAPSSDSSGLMMSPDRLAAQRAGGTWTDIIDSDGWASGQPALAWLIVVEGIALLAFPLAFVVFRPLADRGWLFSKALGLLAVALVVWLMASMELAAFGRSSVAVGVLALFAVGLALLIANGRAMRKFLKERWRTVALAEMLFLAAFLAFMLVRMANPDLFHPWRGGEKSMDMAYLNAVLKSSYMPPYDPWFGGGYINYYYWGQFLVATLIHATGIVPEVAINLAVPTFFALTAALSYSISYNLAAAARRARSRAGPPAYVAGLAGALFVAVLGNLDGAIQVGQGIWRVAVQGLPAPPFDFWRSSRMMPPDPPGWEITEFPFFTFLFADPHAHMFALPFTLLSVGIAAAVVLERSPARSIWSADRLLRLAALGVTVGALRVINTWDYPTYLMFAVAALVLSEWLAHGGLSLAVAARAGAKGAAVFLIGFAAFLPYHLSYETFFDGVDSTTNTTALVQFLAIVGPFVFAIGALYLWELRRPLASGFGRVSRVFGDLRLILSGQGTPEASARRAQLSPLAILFAVAALLLVGYLLTALASGTGWATVLFAAALLCLALAAALGALNRLQADAPAAIFASLMVVTALALVVGLDFVRVEGDIERMNSIFKFYLQVWTLLALAAAYAVWRLLASMKRGAFRRVCLALMAALLLCAAIYPVMGTRDRLRDRFDGSTTPLTLDGLAYMQGTTYRDVEGQIDLEADLEGIRWLRENVAGSPLVLEANTPTYRWGGRVSIHTGLPGVVGWEWHQQQQRWDYRSDVTKRIRDVERIYSTPSPSEATALIERYEVAYVYVGQVERLYYSEEGIAKFDHGLMPNLELSFESERVAIYRVIY